MSSVRGRATTGTSGEAGAAAGSGGVVLAGVRGGGSRAGAVVRVGLVRSTCEKTALTAAAVGSATGVEVPRFRVAVWPEEAGSTAGAGSVVEEVVPEGGEGLDASDPL